MKIIVIPVLLLCLLIFFPLFFLQKSQCVKYSKIVSMDKITKTSWTVKGDEPFEWLYTLDNGDKIRFEKRLYKGERVCIEYKEE